MYDCTSTSADAVRLFEEAVDALLSWHNPFPQLIKALELDSQMCMSRCMSEVVLSMSDIPSSFKGPWPKGGNEREALHVKAAQAWCAGRQGDAELLYAQIVQRWPDDVLAVKFHQDACFFLGRSSSMQAAERTADIWRQDRASHKRFPYVLGLAAFAAEENARYADALLAGKEAVNLLPTEQWAIHAVAHVYEMQCQPRQGYTWLQTHRSGWTGPERLLSPHIAWHGALYSIEGGKPRDALAVWDKDIAPLIGVHEGAVLDLIDATSLLLRLEFAGLDSAELAPRYETLLPFWEPHVDRRSFLFNDLHMLIAAEGANRSEISTHIVAALDEYGLKGTDKQAEVARAVASPLCTALRSWHAKDYAKCSTAISCVLPTVQMIGGSHAQRDLFAQLSLQSTLRAKLPALLVAQERAQKRPDDHSAWSAYAAALTNETEAASARAASLVWE